MTLQDYIKENIPTCCDRDCMSDEPCYHLTETDINHLIDYIVDKMQMEGMEHKLTPFQQTVNTYIKNRGEEIKRKELEELNEKELK